MIYIIIHFVVHQHTEYFLRSGKGKNDISKNDNQTAKDLIEAYVMKGHFENILRFPLFRNKMPVKIKKGRTDCSNSKVL